MPLTRKPTVDEINAAMVVGPRSPQFQANRVRRMFSDHLEQAKLSAEQIRLLVSRSGLQALQAELGDDGAQLVPTYNALKTCILALDPDAEVPDLS